MFELPIPAVGSVNAHHLAEKFAVVLVHNHDAILPPDKQTMLRRIGHDVIPSAISAKHKRIRNLVERWSLRGQYGCNQQRGDTEHHSSFIKKRTSGRTA